MSKRKFWSRASEYLHSNRESVILCVMFFLALVTAVSDRFFLNRSKEFLGTLIFEIIIFVIPLLVYYGLSNKSNTSAEFVRQLHIFKFSPRLIAIPVLAALMIISAGAILDVAFFGMHDLTDGFTLYGQFTAVGDESFPSMIYMIATFVLLPAVFEEIIFRRIVTSTYAKRGMLPALFASAMFFSMTAFTLRLVPSFLFAGLIYGIIYVVTGSLLVSIVAHLLVNLYGLFLKTNVANYYVGLSDRTLFVLFFAIMLILSAILLCTVIAKLFIGYARAEKEPPSVPNTKKGFLAALGSAASIFKIPTNIACVVIFALFVVIFALFG